MQLHIKIVLAGKAFSQRRFKNEEVQHFVDN
jgi:hypothetical protein